jgi:hypothetical protein
MRKHILAILFLSFGAAANQNIPDSSVCKCNTREIAKGPASAMLA